MKRTLAALTLAATLALPQTGCRTMTEPQRLALVEIVVTEASYVGGAYALVDQPELRAPLAAAVAALDALIARESFSVENLRAALNGIPALRGSQGALLDAGLTLYIVGTGFVDIDSAPYVAAVARGTRAGIARALARPTGTATRILAGPLPNQCIVPARAR
jgi:hypothetical protein